MHRILRRPARIPLILGIVAVLVLGSAAPASADTVLTTLTVASGTLNEVAVPTAVATGAPGANATYTMTITVTDTRGSGLGWNMTVTSTAFHPVTGSDFPDNASTITGVTAACLPVCTTPTNAIGYALGLPAAATAPTAVKFYNAAVGTGMGIMSVTPSVSVAIPLTASSVAYVSTVTLSLVSAP